MISSLPMPLRSISTFLPSMIESPGRTNLVGSMSCSAAFIARFQILPASPPPEPCSQQPLGHSVP